MTARNENEDRHPIPQEALDWYDEYAHGFISRREFFERFSTLTVLGFSVSALSAALIPNYALAEQVSLNDPDIKAPLLTSCRCSFSPRMGTSWTKATPRSRG